MGGAVAGLLGRLVLGVAALPLGLGLIGSTLLGAIVGAAGGIAAMRRKGTAADMPYGAVAGAAAGLLGAEVAVMACRAVEPILGSWQSLATASVLWGLIGAGLAGLSLAVASAPEPRSGGSS